MLSLTFWSSAAVILAACVSAIPRMKAARPFIGSDPLYTSSPSKDSKDRLALPSIMSLNPTNPMESMKPMKLMKPTDAMNSMLPKNPEKPMPPHESPFDGDIVIELSASPEAILDPFQPPVSAGDNGLEPSETPDMQMSEFMTPPKVMG